MFAGLLATWWYASERREEEERARKEEEKKKNKKVDEDGLTEDEEDTDEEMPEIRRRFKAAVDYLRGVTDQLGPSVLLRLYGLYKVATVGKPYSMDRPSFFDHKNRAKFDAWAAAARGMTQKDAMREYSDALETLGVGFDPSAIASTSYGGLGMRMSRPMAEGGDMNNGGSPTRSPDAMEWSLWAGAARNDDVETVKRLLALNPDILLRRGDDTGSTGMHWAADSGSLKVVQYLYSLQPSLITELDTEGNHPLHLAALCDHEPVVKFLMLNGARATILNLENETAIDIAATPVLKQWMQARADELEELEEQELLLQQAAAAAAAAAVAVPAAAPTEVAEEVQQTEQ